MHCDGAVLPERPGAGSVAQAPVMRQGAATPWPTEVAADEEAREPMRAAPPKKIGMAALWVVIAIVTGILRACSERG